MASRRTAKIISMGHTTCGDPKLNESPSNVMPSKFLPYKSLVEIYCERTVAYDNDETTIPVIIIRILAIIGLLLYFLSKL